MEMEAAMVAMAAKAAGPSQDLSAAPTVKNWPRNTPHTPRKLEAVAVPAKVDKEATQVHHQAAQAHQAQAPLDQVVQVAPAAVAHLKKLNSVTREMEVAMVATAAKAAGPALDHLEAQTVKT